MGLKQFFTGKTESTTVENSGVVSSATPNAENAALNTGADGIIAKRRGRPAGSGSKSKLDPRQAEMEKAFDALYAPETWEGIVCAPADTMLAVSGKQLWDMSDKERKTLSVHASLTARCFAVENPKYLALVMLSISIAQIYGARISMHMMERAKERKAEEMRNKAAGKPELKTV